ncbi:hypothetical protein [Catellatospora methionotrophica]|uniref:hypothetical protein n=1 Tax=Catellatospora methionotrophica TaxID=121620 RepID=UPI0033E8CA5B
MTGKLRGLHSYWHVPGERPLPYRRLALPTWLLGVLSWQRHAGPIDLLADQPTADWLDALGLLDGYDRVEVFDATEFDGRYRRAECFALPKLLGMARHPGSVLVDTDAFLLGELRLEGTGSHFAHLERGDAPFYARLHEVANPAGVNLPSSLPYVGNTALFRAADADLARRISAAGLAFLDGNPGTPGRDAALHMTVAEQVLATHLTAEAGHEVVNVFGALWSPHDRHWDVGPPAFGHLWHLKRYHQPGGLAAAYARVSRILRDEYGVGEARLRELVADL